LIHRKDEYPPLAIFQHYIAFSANRRWSSLSLGLLDRIQGKSPLSDARLRRRLLGWSPPPCASPIRADEIKYPPILGNFWDWSAFAIR
jgi:hypothetical protein